MTDYVKVKSCIPTAAAFVLVGGLALSLEISTIERQCASAFEPNDKLELTAFSSNAQTQYKIADEKLDTFKKIDIIQKFASNLLENIEDLDPEFSKIIYENYWDLI